MSASQHSYTFDASTELRDRADGAETGSGAETKVLDFGNVTSGLAVTQVAYVAGSLVIDVDALDFTTGDESYDILVQLSDNATFSSGNVATKAKVHLGAAEGADGDDQSGLGRLVIGVDNEFQGTLFRFMRLANVLGGTSPSITYEAFLSRNAPSLP